MELRYFIGKFHSIHVFFFFCETGLSVNILMRKGRPKTKTAIMNTDIVTRKKKRKKKPVYFTQDRYKITRSSERVGLLLLTCSVTDVLNSSEVTSCLCFPVKD